MKYSILFKLGVLVLLFSVPARADDRPEFNYNVDQIVADTFSSAGEQVQSAMQQAQGAAEAASRSASAASEAMSGIRPRSGALTGNVTIQKEKPVEMEREDSTKKSFKKSSWNTPEKRKRRWGWFQRRQAKTA